MHPFERYLQENRLEPLTLAALARVRYLVVWKAMKGKPIHRAFALQMRDAAKTLTGIPYSGNIALLPEPPIEQTTTMPLKRIMLLK